MTTSDEERLAAAMRNLVTHERPSPLMDRRVALGVARAARKRPASLAYIALATAAAVVIALLVGPNAPRPNREHSVSLSVNGQHNAAQAAPPSNARTPPATTTIVDSWAHTTTTRGLHTTTTLTPVTSGSGSPTTAVGHTSTTQITAPAAPQVSVTAPAPDQVAATWVPGSGGDPATGYQVSISGGPPVSLSPGTTSHTFRGLVPGTAYTVSVLATNGVGMSRAGTASATTPIPPPILVDNDSAAPPGSSFSASGTPNGNYGGSLECTGPTSPSVGHYPPWTCAQMGGGDSSNGINFSGNQNCVSAGQPFSGSTFTWTVSVPYSGHWRSEVYVPFWTQGGFAVYNFNFDGGSSSANVSQDPAGSNQGTWQVLGGSSPMSAGGVYSIVLTTADFGDGNCHYDTADQLRWIWVGP